MPFFDFSVTPVIILVPDNHSCICFRVSSPWLANNGVNLIVRGQKGWSMNSVRCPRPLGYAEEVRRREEKDRSGT